jgi:hypothetical protein
MIIYFFFVYLFNYEVVSVTSGYVTAGYSLVTL